MRWRLGAAVVGAAVLAVATSGLVSAQTAAPTIGLSTGSAEPGQTVLVLGRGWAPSALVDLAVCGGAGLGSSSDCAVASARQAFADTTGSFTDAMTVAIPPAPCPCVVRARSGEQVAVAPLAVVGAPVALPTAPLEGAAADLEVETTLEGSGPWTSWFGASPQRDLVVTVRNVGDVAVPSPELAVSVDDGGGAPRTVTTATLDPLAPGAEVVERIGIGLGGLSWGGATVRAEVSGAGEPVAAESGTSSYPWALMLAAVFVLQAGLLAGRNRLRRRLAVDADLPSRGGTPMALPPAEEIIDLTEAQPQDEPAGDVDPTPERPEKEPALVDDADRPVSEEITRYRALAASADEAFLHTRLTVGDAAATADRSVRQAVASFEVQVASATAALEAATGAWRTEVTALCEHLLQETVEARTKEFETVAAADAATVSLLEALREASDRLFEVAPAGPAGAPQPAPVLDVVDRREETFDADPIGAAIRRAVKQAVNGG